MGSLPPFVAPLAPPGRPGRHSGRIRRAFALRAATVFFAAVAISSCWSVLAWVHHAPCGRALFEPSSLWTYLASPDSGWAGVRAWPALAGCLAAAVALRGAMRSKGAPELPSAVAARLAAHVLALGWVLSRWAFPHFDPQGVGLELGPGAWAFAGAQLVLAISMAATAYLGLERRGARGRTRA